MIQWNPSIRNIGPRTKRNHEVFGKLSFVAMLIDPKLPHRKKKLSSKIKMSG